MRALILSRYGTTDDLGFDEVATPEPAAGEVRVRVHAAGVNDWDWGMVRGSPLYIRLLCGLWRPRIRIPGVDVAGVVDAVGTDVTGLAVGDRVYGDVSEAGFGAFAEAVCAPVAAVTKMPASMDFTTAAALPHAATLALQSLRLAGNVPAGARILVNGAGGGMGTLAAQMLRARGCDDLTGVDHGDKADLMRASGYRQVIDYTKEDFTTRGERYDLILDTKTNRPARHYRRALTPTGVYVTVGGDIARILAIALRQRSQRSDSGQRLHVLGLKPNDGMDEINGMFETGHLKPAIDGPHDFNDLPAAIQRFGEGGHLGKVVVTVV